jgi:prophage DNA circulation protein
VAAADFSAAAVQLADALQAATIDPADAIRLLLPLADFQPGTLPGTGSVAIRAQTAQEAMASNLRCAACAALARSARAYQPASYEDALALRRAVCGALDREATRSADAGRDATYRAVSELRAAVALDLAVRGANLASLIEIITRVSMPSLVEAWSLYQDTTREPQLTASADPPHPLFLPAEFAALSR